jgi:hypothetical protein
MGAIQQHPMSTHGAAARIVPCILSMMISCVVTERAMAGPDWDEICDAGGTPGGAQVITSPVKTIRGRLNACALAGTPDMEDMYRFTINVPTIFCARTVLLGTNVDCCGEETAPATQGTTFDTQLWLFRSTGHGLLANDNESGSSTLSFLPNAANDSTGAMVVLPGIYYLAISGKPNRVPVDASNNLIFSFASATEVSGPDGQGGANPMVGWIGSGATGPSIQYEIFICGSVPVIPAMTNTGLMILASALVAIGIILIGRRSGALPA